MRISKFKKKIVNLMPIWPTVTSIFELSVTCIQEDDQPVQLPKRREENPQVISQPQGEVRPGQEEEAEERVQVQSQSERKVNRDLGKLSIWRKEENGKVKMELDVEKGI